MATQSHRASRSLHAVGREERSSKVKTRKVMGWDGDMQKKQNRGFVPQFLPAYRHSAFPTKAGKTNTITLNVSPSFLLPTLTLYALYNAVVWNIPWVSQGQLSQLCPFPTTFALAGPLLEGWGEEQQGPWHCSHEHVCVINTVFNTNPKHSSVPDKEN